MTTNGTGSASITVAAPAAVIYDLIADVARMGEWSPECVGADAASGVPVDVGFTFTGRNRRGDQEWTTACEVVAADRPALFSFVAGDDDTPTTWSYELRAVGTDRTEVTESFDSAALRDPEAAEQLGGRREQLVADLATTLDGLRAVAERECDR